MGRNQNSFISTISLNPDHEIYKGHFAKIPVVPGVCLVQIVKEILMKHFQKKLLLTEGKNLKYLALINPKEVNTLQVQFSLTRANDLIDATVNILSEGNSYTKLKLLFKEV